MAKKVKSRNCPDCGVEPGENHQGGCDVERCPYCGHQIITCSCKKNIPAKELMPWTGEWPGDADCIEYGLYSKMGANGWEKCSKDDPEGGPDLNTLYAEYKWDRKLKKFIPAAQGAKKTTKKTAKIEYKNIKELSNIIEKLSKKFGTRKVNIVHDNAGNEGIWCCPVDAESTRLFEDDTSWGEEIFVRLMNQPLWDGYSWGSLVRAMTNGSSRPTVASKQTHPLVLADKKQLLPIVKAHLKERMAKCGSDLPPKDE